MSADPVSVIVHSGLRRTERLAQMIATRTGAPLKQDERWRERDFGSWEGRTWQSIWRETGDLMERMMTHPEEFRPGGGETTAELFRRAGKALNDVPGEEHVIVVAHGGSIAAARAVHAGLSVDQLVRFIPSLGTVSIIDRARRPGRTVSTVD